VNPRARDRTFFEIVSLPAQREDGADEVSVVAELTKLSPAARAEHMLQIVLFHTCAVLRQQDVDSIDPKKGFKDIGLDSLMAVELQQRLMRVTALSLPATLAFDYPSPAQVAGLLLKRLALSEESPAEVEAEQLHASERDLENLGEDDLLDAAADILGDLE
jgi:acyl carrier protein